MGKKKNPFNWQEKNQELVALIRARKAEEAVELGKELVEYVDRAFKKKDAAEKATSYNNMGMALMLAQDYELSETCFRQALAMRKRLFGEDHNEVAVIMMNLSHLYRIQAQEIMMVNRVEVDQDAI